MSRPVWSLIFIPLCFQLLACSGGSPPTSPEPSGPDSDAVSRLAGSWRLLSWTRTSPGGEIVYPQGPDAFGRIIYQPDGRMMVVLMRRGRPPLSIDEASPEEVQVMVVDGFSSYTGRYRVDEQAETVTHQVEASLSPHWVGTEQVRRYQFLPENRLALRLQTPPPGTQGWQTELIWERE